MEAPLPQTISPPSQYNAVIGEIHCDASDLLYMTYINTLFNRMILIEEEQFTCENLNHYTTFLKETLTYFGGTKMTQMMHRR
jgi:hypothetical protein